MRFLVANPRLYLLLLAALSSLALLGCAVPIQPQASKVGLPADLIQDCMVPEVHLSTLGELADSLQRYIGALSECNVDKASLREWDAAQP